MSDKEHEQAGHGGGHGHDGEAVYPYTPHHFDDGAKQHFESGKMGVWLFLVTEILFFAGLFCAYTIYRGQHPEVFYWAHFYLDTFWGAVNTVVLILSSFTAAWAVRNAQLGQTRLLKMNIMITILGAFIFMGVKSVEYSHKFHDGLLPAGKFAPKHEVWDTPAFQKQHPESAAAAKRIIAGILERKNKQAAVVDEVLDQGERLALVPVVDTGEIALNKASDTKKTVAPPKAAAPKEIAAPLRATAPLKATAPQETAAPKTAVSAKDAESKAAADQVLVEAAPQVAPAPVETKTEEVLTDDVWLSRQIHALTHDERHPLERAGIIRAPADGPLEFSRPDKAGVFFSIYFFMTGLHGFHVLIGIGLWVWMLSIVNRRKMGKKYFGPIEFTALYWHLVDLIWIYLFPMLYLIH